MLTMRNIAIEGDKVLYKKAKEVKLPLNKKDKLLAGELLDFIKNSQNPEIREQYNLRESVGIAAPQVKVSKRMFAMHFQDFDGMEEFSYVVINPKILSHSNEIIYLPSGEGCLSVIEETNNQLTPRYSEIKVSFTKYNPIEDTLEEVTETISNYPAIVFQHEFDHLDGILFTSKLFEKLDEGFSVFTKYPDLEISEPETNEP